MLSTTMIDGKRYLVHENWAIRFPPRFSYSKREIDGYHELRYNGIDRYYSLHSVKRRLFDTMLKLVEMIEENESIYDVDMNLGILIRRQTYNGIVLPLFVRTKTYKGVVKQLIFRDPFRKTYTCYNVSDPTTLRRMENLSDRALDKIKQTYLSYDDFKASIIVL